MKGNLSPSIRTILPLSRIACLRGKTSFPWIPVSFPSTSVVYSLGKMIFPEG